MPGPWEKYQQQPGFIPDPTFPGKLQGQNLNNEGQALQNVRTQQQIQTQPLQNESTRVGIEQNRQSMQNQRFNQNQGLRQEWNNLPLNKNFQVVMQKAGGALSANDTSQGDLAVLYAFATVMDPDSVVRESEQDMAKSTASRFEQLKTQYNMGAKGARLPDGVRPGLQEQIRANTKVISQFYGQQRGFYADLAKRNGFDPHEIVGPDPLDQFSKIETDYIKQRGGTPKINGVPTSERFRNETDPVASAQMDAAIRSGLSYEQASEMAKAAGYPPPDRGTYNEAVKFAKNNRGYKNSLAEATRTVPTTAFERFAASPVGAAISGAAKAATMGTADNIAGALGADPEAFRQAQDALAAQHPTADLIGQVGGGATAGIGISSALSRIPGMAGGMFGSKIAPNLLSREGMVGDTLYGAGYGAGSEDDNRLQGALTGGLTGLGGGIAARGAVGGAASAISPTGGALRPLYDMGVRPSIGQRLGGVVNNLEEKFQSIPLVGDAIKGTRDRARDQFQIGLFNDSLKDIGQSLPEGMGVGHEPHAFAQGAFNKAYDAAKSNMTAVVDGPFSQDIGNLQQTVGALRPESQQQFAKVWSGSVARRIQDGALSGRAFKDATSEIEKKVAALRNSKTGDGELADALQQASDALKSSAMRNSPPEVVAAMNAADSGYAKLVRIEEASRKAGGEPAEFSPSQYNTAVKSASGGVRNREYLRGAALNADIAALGTRLGDKVSNSGTVDRLAAGGAAYGLGAVNPYAASFLGALGTLNAPGVRNVVTELMAPRASPFFDRTAEQLRQRARLAGMFGAPLALGLEQ
jgi:hypothetical protein